MSDTTTETEDEVQETETGGEERTTDDPRISKANAEAARYRKELRAAQTELEKVRKAGLSEQEKAVAEAEQRGAEAAAGKVGARLVRAEFRAAAAGQVDKDTLTAYLEDVDLSKFLDDDGEPDTKAIEARIKLGGGKATSFDGGARTTAAQGTDMNSLIRQRAGLS